MSTFTKAGVILVDPRERLANRPPVPNGIRRDSCPWGHSMEDAYQRKRDGAWECRTCRRRRSAERNRRIRAIGQAVPPPPVAPPLGAKLKWENLDDAPLGATPLEVCHVE